MRKATHGFESALLEYVNHDGSSVRLLYGEPILFTSMPLFSFLFFRIS